MTQRVFADESKARHYLLAAATLPFAGLVSARQAMRGLLLPGQRRIHMHKENDRRRNIIAAEVLRQRANVVLYDAGTKGHDRRERCLRALVADLASDEETILITLETDEGLVATDRAILHSAVHTHGRHERILYEHAQAREELLLVIPDVVAWCWARGNRWKSLIAPIVSTVRRV
jgi:hypothetical protein